MRHRNKTMLPLLAAALLAASALAGCSKSNNDAAGPSQPAQSSSAQPSSSASQEVKEALPSELIVSSFNWGWPTVDEAQDRIGPELEKALGFKVKLDVIKVGSSDEADKKLQLWAATKAADMPDILMTSSSTIAAQTIDSLGRNGILLDWNEILDRMPNFTGQVGQHLKITSDVETGKQFRVPQNFGSIKSPSKPGAGPLIRKDWLDQLGLPVPKTTEELYNALVAFRDNIKLPDGQKVIPSIDFGEMFWTNKYMFDNPKHAYAASGNVTFGLNDWFTDENGTVQRHDMVYSENLLQFISYYNRLYKEGLIDKESLTMKYGQFEEKLASGRVGAFSTWGTHVMTANDAMASIDPKALFVGTYAFDKVTNPNMETDYVNKPMLSVYSYWIVKKDISEEKLNALIKYFEYTMGDEGWKLTNFGQEGKDWTYDAAGKIVETQESIDKYKGNTGAKIPEGIWYYSPTPNFDLTIQYYAPTAYDNRADVIGTWENIKDVYKTTSYNTDKAAYVLPGPIEVKKGAGYANRWKDMVVSGVMAASDEEIKQIIAKWQETERKLGYDEISAERTANLITVPDLSDN